ncbi:MAG: hypothetical protein HY873_08335 [Chloroflexi bacterium]|nr:hypothetical protein [Chloroflexota bacterium]
MPERDDDGWSLTGAILSLLSDFWSFLLFSCLMPSRNNIDEDAAQKGHGDVNSLPEPADPADHPLEQAPRRRHLENRSVEGDERGREDDVSDEFLSQLEQRTQQVKITLANLEADKVRIEGLIAQLQPLVPHYDALLAAERQINEANISLESAHPASEEPPPAEGSGWTSDAPADAPGEQGNSGWSGSWKS